MVSSKPNLPLKPKVVYAAFILRRILRCGRKEQHDSYKNRHTISCRGRAHRR
jgi:hypothetical protein